MHRRASRALGPVVLALLGAPACSPPPATPQLIPYVEPSRGMGSPEPCHDLMDCESACDRGDVEACRDAMKGMRAHPLDGDARRWAKVLERACSGEIAEACGELAEMLLRSPSIAPEPQRAQALKARACDLGSFKACLDAVPASEADAPDGPSPASKALLSRSRALAEKACDARDGTACAQLAATYFLFEPRDEEKASALFARAMEVFEARCRHNYGEDCARAAVDFPGMARTATARQNTDNTAPANAPASPASRRKELLERACTLEAFEACMEIAERPDMTPDLRKAYLTMACHGEREDACLALGKAYRDGVFTYPNPELGPSFLVKGVELARARCDMADSQGCSTLANALAMGFMTAAEGATTADFLESVCNRDSAVVCGKLADALTTSLSVSGDPERIARLKKKACELGYPFACPDPMAAMRKNSGRPRLP
jgi:TPR repeat protein